MQSIALDGDWEVLPMDLDCRGTDGLKKVHRRRSGWIPVDVPGEIHLDLIRAGKMEEPTVSTRMGHCRWPELKSWWYRCRFEVTKKFLAEESQQLVFEGVDCYAQYFINGRFAGESRNSLVPHTIGLRDFWKDGEDHRACYLREGKNELIVRVTSGQETVSEIEPDPRLETGDTSPEKGREKWNGNVYLRKPQFVYGWDWVPALPNIGLWRPVRLEGRSGAVIDDLRLSTRLERSTAVISVEAVIENVHPWASCGCGIEFELSDEAGVAAEHRENINAQIGRQTVRFEVRVPKAKLWWPNGLGAPWLYRVETRLFRGGKITDERSFNYGLRTITINQSPAPQGRRFCVTVNGREVFCKGGNWVPPDPIIARVDHHHLEELLGAAAEANINMLRVWGGGVYESDAFYDLCDRKGILVWQDFIFACAPYPDQLDWFRQAVRDEAEAAVRRLRHHPSLALWCGNNENVWGFHCWWNKPEEDPFDKGRQAGGSVVYNRILPEVCGRLDPDRPYWPSSPCGGPEPNGETAGDCHWWHPGTMNEDPERRINHEVYDECRARFVSEWGVIGPCHLASRRKYLLADEREFGTPADRFHTNTFEKSTLVLGLQRHYADTDGLSLADHTLYGQMFQATMYAGSIEAMRFRSNDTVDDCQGALIWMYNDCWGETGWSVIDYYLSRKPSYYWLAAAFRPLRAIVRRRGNHLVTRVVNDGPKPKRVILHRGWMRLDGTDSHLTNRKIKATPAALYEAGRDKITAKARPNPAEWLYAAWLEIDGEHESPSIWLPHPRREMAMVEPDIKVKSGARNIVVSSPVYCHGVHLPDDGEGVLQDNYFDLLPGIPRRIAWHTGKRPKKIHFHAVTPAR